MNLRLVQKYNFNNVEGQEIEILDIQRHSNYASGFRCLAKLKGFQEPVWLTIDWFCKQEERQTKRAPDAPKRGAKVVKSKSKVIKGQTRR